MEERHSIEYMEQHMRHDKTNNCISVAYPFVKEANRQPNNYHQVVKVQENRDAESAGSWDPDPRQFSLDMLWQAVLSNFFMRQAVFCCFFMKKTLLLVMK